MFKTKETALRNISKLKFSKKEFNLFRNDKEVVLEAVKKDSYALQYASDELKNDKEVVLEAVKKDGWALKYASYRLLDDKEVVLAAVEQDGWALQFASDSLKEDKEVVLEAVKKDSYALQYASDELINDKEVVLEAVKKDGRALMFASERLRDDKDVLNSMRDFLVSDKCPKDELFFNAKETLFQYDEQDRREKELLSKLADLDKLQAQQQNSITQHKVEVKSRRKV